MSVLVCIALSFIGYVLGATTIYIIFSNRFEEPEDEDGIW